MLDSAEELMSGLLLGTVEELDLPPHLYAAADRRYRDVGGWLSAGTGSSWDVYPQGSFRLGTVVRPVVRQDEYDIDLVCLRNVSKASITQQILKSDAGYLLTLYVIKHRDERRGPTGLSNGKRCWTLSYPEFHMDVLPSIPDPDNGPSGILITDRELRLWQPSDPVGYAAWFHRRMAIEFAQKRAELAASRMAASVVDVPEWEVKTTLQREVQVFKRHRDLYFANDLDNRPPSILITTLAAHAYRGAGNLFTSVLEAARLMPMFIEETSSGWRVENPVQRDENFADRWGAVPSRAKKFFAWLNDLTAELEEAADTRDLAQVTKRLSSSFGAEPVTRAAKRLGASARDNQEAGRLRMAAGTGMLGSAAAHRVPRHDFYGDEPNGT